MRFLSLSYTRLHSYTHTHTHTHTHIQEHAEATVHDTIVLDDETDSYSDGELHEFSCVSDSDADDESYEYSYTLKLVNPTCKKDFTSVELGRGKRFKHLSSLQQFISKKLSTNPKLPTPDFKNVDMGYVTPGHGMKGRKIWIHVDDDVKMMYEKHEKKRSILLWCYTKSSTQAAQKKEAAGSSKTTKSGTKYGQHLEERTAVDDLYKELQEKHTSYSPRRLRAWANMVHMKTWSSLDEPPNKPFFTHGRKRSNEASTSEEPPTSKIGSTSAPSPGKKARVRSELIDQLDKFHRLLESGALSSAEYSELRSTILTDIKNL